MLTVKTQDNIGRGFVIDVSYTDTIGDTSTLELLLFQRLFGYIHLNPRPLSLALT